MTLMAVEIIPIKLGFDQCYVLKSDGIIAVDAGAPNRGEQRQRASKLYGTLSDQIEN